MDDPFSKGHRAAERKEEADKVKQEITARNARIEAAEKARKAPRPAPKPYVPEPPPWRR